jgi:hypothetical protein
MPGEGRVSVLIRAVWEDLYDPVENPPRESCEGGFLQSFRGGIHDLLRQKPSSLFILLGWSSISVTSLMGLVKVLLQHYQQDF